MLPYWIGFASDAALAKKYQHLTFFFPENQGYLHNYLQCNFFFLFASLST